MVATDARLSRYYRIRRPYAGIEVVIVQWIQSCRLLMRSLFPHHHWNSGCGDSGSWRIVTISDVAAAIDCHHDEE